MVALVPIWACVGIAATLGEVEAVVETREGGGSWPACASAAGMESGPRKLRRWFRRFAETMCAAVVLIPGLMVPSGQAWVGALRQATGVTGPGVFVAVRWQLYREHRVVFGPLCLLTHERPVGRGPPPPPDEALPLRAERVHGGATARP
jgi:hypothetical protein